MGPAGPEAVLGQGSARWSEHSPVPSESHLGPSCIRVSKDRGCCWPVLRLGHLSLQGRRGDLRSQHELRPHRI